MTTHPQSPLLALSPCPFCSDESQVILRQDGMNHAVVCNAGSGGCGARGPYKVGEFDAIAAWNTRSHQFRPATELPKHYVGGEFGRQKLYTADQMRAYATEAAAYWKEMHRAANARGENTKK